jgi:soluble lytic murein transglycosylase-like protein
LTPILVVRSEDGRTFRFSRSFHIGREHDCGVRIEDGRVSRKHVLVSFDHGRWQVSDQKSGNGVYVNGRRVETVPVDHILSIRLGPEGPLLTIEVEGAAAQAARPSAAPPPAGGETMLLQSYVERYFGEPTGDEPVGGRTLMIRKAFSRIQRKQRRTYTVVVGLAVLAALAAVVYAYYSHRRLQQQKEVAEELFYTMKALDVNIANLERLVASSGNADAAKQVKEYLERRRQLESNYDQFLGGQRLYDHKLTPQEQTILRVTRLFGECETAAPPEYLAEVTRYIRMWQTTGRYANGVLRAQQMGYTRKIAQAFQAQNLPAQFFYLALQESGFNETAVGPPTRMGFAKGMWQFVPDTATRYGLTVGPLAGSSRPDPSDDRHKWEKATDAAARYIKDIYSTDAQASGLLVMASYNWGEGRVIRMLRAMPPNPRDRNFWKVLALHRDQVPKETYDYVLYIVSAAAIGENPKLFGFAFDSPLAFLDKP